MNRENTKSINSDVLKTISETLDIDQTTAEQVFIFFLFSFNIYQLLFLNQLFYFIQQLINELSLLIKKILFDGLTDLVQIQDLFTQCSLQTNLKNLLCKLLVEKIPQFKKTLVEEQSK